MNITEPSVDANSDEIVSKKSKIDLSPPATPPKRPAPEVRSCDLAHMINYNYIIIHWQVYHIGYFDQSD